MTDTFTDTTTDDYLAARNVWQRCRLDLCLIDPKDRLFDAVAELCVLAKQEMEYHARSLPF